MIDEVSRIGDSALDLPPGPERDAYVEQECAADSELMSRVLRYIAGGNEHLPAIEGPVATRLAVGTRLGDYEVLAYIAAGGMGEVYKARDTRLLRDVALKLMPVDVMACSEIHNRFIREARAASALNHPNIVTIYDIARQGPLQFIVMEYVQGKTLDHFIPVDLVSGLRIACQVASALAKAHSASIVHRDIKPGNVMLTDDGTVKVVDFGLAKMEEPTVNRRADLTQTGAIVGTPAYMSPEQAAGKQIDRRSDIFSFGLLLYEMLSGQRAFSGGTPEAIMQDLRHGRPPSLHVRLSQVTPELDLIVKRCLDTEPSQRFQSMVDVKIALEKILSSGSAAGSIPSIAVLPFVNLGANKEDEYFADGLAEEIINLLARTPNMKVIARTSSFVFRDKDLQIEEIARKLNVDHLVEGSLRRIGSRIRVTTHLVKALDGVHLWSQRFDRDMADVFTVQEEIAVAIATELNGTLARELPGSQETRRRPTLDAYNAFLKGRYHLHRFTAADQTKAKEYFEAAIALDPGYALAYSGLAMYYAFGRNSFSKRSTVESLLDNALRLDPSLAEAHALRGLNLGMLDHAWEAAEQEFHKALTSTSVSADVYYQYTSGFLMAMQRFEEASIAIERARQLDPLVPVFAVSASAVHFSMGQFQRAIDDCDNALELDERFWIARINKARFLVEMGDTSKALAEYELVQQLIGFDNPFVLSHIADLFARTHREDEARSILARLLEERTNTFGKSWMLGGIYYSLGELEQVFACMNAACDEHDPRVLWFVADPRVSAALGGDTRFQALLRRMNLLTCVQSEP